MNLPIDQVELLRGRWRRAREPLRLTDPSDEDFGTGGLAALAPEACVRLLILPSDPEATLISEFDPAFWEWWGQARPNPFHGAAPTDWGPQRRPTVEAAVRSRPRDSGRWVWDTYLALHRSGAMEFGLALSPARGARPHPAAAEMVLALQAMVTRCPTHPYSK